MLTSQHKCALEMIQPEDRRTLPIFDIPGRKIEEPYLRPSRSEERRNPPFFFRPLPPTKPGQVLWGPDLRLWSLLSKIDQLSNQNVEEEDSCIVTIEASKLKQVFITGLMTKIYGIQKGLSHLRGRRFETEYVSKSSHFPSLPCRKKYV